MNPFARLVRKDLVIYFSNRRALLMNLLAPILIAAFFGSVFTSSDTKASPMPIGVVDLDRSAVTKRIVEAMRGDDSIELLELADDEAQARVRGGKLGAAIEFPAGFGAAATHGLFNPDVDKPAAVLMVDPSKTAVPAMARGLLMQHAMQAIMIESVPARAFSLPFTVDARAETTADKTEYNGYAHAFAGMSVQFVMFMAIDLGIGVLLARRLGLWGRMRAAPIGASLLYGSRLASGSVIAALLMAGIYAAAFAVFGVRIQGSVVGFVLILASFSIMTAAFGLLIAALGSTPEATRGLAIFVTLMLVMLGGAWVPSFVFPAWLQHLTLFVPTRWAIDGFEAMTWRGQPLTGALAPVAVLLGSAIVFGAIAVVKLSRADR